MDSKETCEEEITVLQSIYDNKIQVKPKKFPQGLKISLEGNCSKSEKKYYNCIVQIQYPSNYPASIPEFSLLDCATLTDSMIAELNDLMNRVANENIGDLMVFPVISEVQEKLNDFADNYSFDLAGQEERKRKEREREEEKKFYGTKVTAENFLKWRTEFVREMESRLTKEEKDLQDKDNENLKRLTGRQMFLRDNRFDDSDLNFLKTDDDNDVNIDETLFENLDELVLDDDERE